MSNPTLFRYSREVAFHENDDIGSVRQKLNVEFDNVARMVTDLNRVMAQIVKQSSLTGKYELTEKVMSSVSTSAQNAGFSIVYGPVVDDSVPTSGRDFPLPAAFSDPARYMIVGHAVAGGYDVGYVEVKGVNTINLRPNGTSAARIEFVVILSTGEQV